MKQFYRQGEKIFEAGTNRYIDYPEWKRDWDGQATEVSNPSEQSKRPTTNTNDYRRTDDGYTEKLVNPLDEWKNQTSFLDTARNIIQKKQNFNKTLQSRETSLRNLYKDTSPFGSEGGKVAAKAAGLPSAYSDERLRLLSPSDQASVRRARDTAIEGHLRGLKDEREYRGTRVDDVIGSLTDHYEELRQTKKDERQATLDAIKLIKEKQAAGLPITDANWEAAGESNVFDGKKDTSVSYRNNNPLNIKYGEFAKGYGATPNVDATDGGTFAKFPDYETGWQAAKDLLKKGYRYKNEDLDYALRIWSGGIDENGNLNGAGYDTKDLFQLAQRSYSWGNKTTGEMNDKEIEELMNLMKQAEGWDEGTKLEVKKEEPEDKYSNAKIIALAEKANMPLSEIENMTDDERVELSNKINNSITLKLVEEGLLTPLFLATHGIDFEVGDAILADYSEQMEKNGDKEQIIKNLEQDMEDYGIDPTIVREILEKVEEVDVTL